MILNIYLQNHDSKIIYMIQCSISYKTWFISEDNIELDAKFKLSLNA